MYHVFFGPFSSREFKMSAKKCCDEISLKCITLLLENNYVDQIEALLKDKDTPDHNKLLICELFFQRRPSQNVQGNSRSLRELIGKTLVEITRKHLKYDFVKMTSFFSIFGH
jgi:hypothetical protein